MFYARRRLRGAAPRIPTAASLAARPASPACGFRRQPVVSFQFAGGYVPCRLRCAEYVLPGPDPRIAIQCPRRNDRRAADFCRPRQRRTALFTKRRGKIFGIVRFVSGHECFPSQPPELAGGNEKIRRMSAAGKFSATRTMAILKYAEIARDLVTHPPAKTTAPHADIRHSHGSCAIAKTQYRRQAEGGDIRPGAAHRAAPKAAPKAAPFAPQPSWHDPKETFPPRIDARIDARIDVVQP